MAHVIRRHNHRSLARDVLTANTSQSAEKEERDAGEVENEVIPNVFHSWQVTVCSLQGKEPSALIRFLSLAFSARDCVIDGKRARAGENKT